MWIDVLRAPTIVDCRDTNGWNAFSVSTTQRELPYRSISIVKDT